MDLGQDVGDSFGVRSLAITYRAGHSLPDHTHPWAQLIFTRSGIMNADTDGQLTRLVHSFSALAAGKPVSVATSESGFESSSAFIAAFKKHFGTTPGKIRIGAG